MGASAETSGSEAITVRFWGVRGSLAAPGPLTARVGGNTPCVEVRCGGEVLVLDAGTGIRALGHALDGEFGSGGVRATVVLSHAHLDHVMGLPFFLPLYRPGNVVRVFGPRAAGRPLDGTVRGLFGDPAFPVEFADLAADVSVSDFPEGGLRVGPLQISAFDANHPGVTVGYRVRAGAGVLGYLPDNEVPCGDCRIHPLGPGLAAGQPGPARSAMVDALRGVDALVIDCQYDDHEISLHFGWGHGSIVRVLDLAEEAGVKRLYLFHHDPDRSDAEVARMEEKARALARGRGLGMAIAAAREGMEFAVGGE